MNRMTRQERTVLAMTLALLLTGLAVKAWRQANHPGATPTQVATRP